MSLEHSLPDGISIERAEISGHLPSNQTLYVKHDIDNVCPVCKTETVDYSFDRIPISHGPKTAERIGWCRNCRRTIHVEYLVPGDIANSGGI